MGRKCLFPWCKSSGALHGFPRDAARARLWLQAVGWPSTTDTSTLFVCSKHFSRESYENWRMVDFGLAHQRSLRLLSDAVPSPKDFSVPSKEEKLEEAMAEMRLCPLCQRRQKDSETLSMHLTKKHSVHPACLDNLLINAPYANRSSGVVSVSISQNFNGTSQDEPSENTKSPLIAVQLDWSSQENDTHGKSGENSGSGHGDPEASVQEDKSNTKTNAAADGSVNHPFKCHACLEFFTHKSALSVHSNSSTHIQKMRTGTGNDEDSSTPILAYPYVSTKPYQCDVCHVSYFYSFGLESHLKSVLHQSRTRKAENAAANFKTNTETRIVMANFAGTPVANATQLATVKTCNCSTQAEKVQLQPVSSLCPAPVMSAQAVPTVLSVLTLASNSVPHTIVPSAIPPSGTSAAQLIPQPQMLMPLIVNELQTQSASPDNSHQILQQAVPVLGLCSAQQVKGLDPGDSQSQSAATGVSGASRVPLDTNTTVDGVGVKVKIEIKEEPCDQEVSQMTPGTADAMSQLGLKQELNSTWDGIEESVLCDDKQPSKVKESSLGINSKRQLSDANQASTTQDSRDCLASKPSCSRLSPELTEFQSQVLWAFIESRNEADFKIPPREDCEALAREVGLTEDEVQKWIMDTYHRHQADVRSLYGRQGSTEDNEDTLMIDKTGGTVLRSTTDFLSDEEEGADEQTTVDKKRKRDMD